LIGGGEEVIEEARVCRTESSDVDTRVEMTVLNPVLIFSAERVSPTSDSYFED
jgi:hypothetical protein